MKKALLVSCFEGWYMKRLEPVHNMLINRGYKVKVLVSDFEHIGHKEITHKNECCTYIHVPPYQNNISIGRIRSHLSFGRQVKKYIYAYQPDLLYLLVPPNNTAIYCNQYKRNNPGCKYIIDIIDLWPESMPLGGLKHTPPAWLWSKIRNDSIKLAEVVFLECELYREKIQHALNCKKSTVLHLFKEQTKEERELVYKTIVSKKDDNIIRLAYLGSINNVIDIDGICNIIRQLASRRKLIQLHIIGKGERQDIFLNSAKEAGCEVIYHGVIYDENQKIRILAKCDYGFNMMKECVSVGLTIKSIDYFAYGLPIINNIAGDTWELVEEYGIGVNVGDAMIKLPRINHMNVVNCFYKYFTKQAFEERVRKDLAL